jgi:hypothetical protein
MEDQAVTGAPSRGARVIVSALVSIILTALVVTLRFYTRSTIIRFLGCDDWCIGIAFVGSPAKFQSHLGANMPRPSCYH